MEEVEKYLRKIKKPVTMEQILEKVSSFGNYDLEQVKELIYDKVKKYEFIVTESGKYIPIIKTSFRVGTYHEFKDSNGIVECGENKYPISREDSTKIIDGDLVLVDTNVISNKRGCHIEKILDRNVNGILGEVKKIGDNYFVIPEIESKRKLSIILNGEEYIEGEKVIVDCIEKRSDNFYVGSIKKSIGHKDDPGVDILMEAYKYNITNDITEEELKELDNIPTHVLDIDKIGRMDFTEKEIFTIDGVDAKDLDDAVSLEKLENGNYLLGVYIADVSHYVEKDSLLDLRARNKGTSSYLANTVIPMLPHKLSNGICSLNPNVERLALSCIMEITPQGERVNYNVYEAVIKSNLKMSYDKVNDILDRNIIAENYEKHVNTLKNMEELSKILHQRRITRGAVELDRPELKLIIDENGKVTDFDKRIQGTGESIIEEFMLITNETIAEDMFKNHYPLIFRNHEEPKEEKIDEYLTMLKTLGYKLDFKKNDPKLGQKLSEFICCDETLANTLQTKLLKSFRRAFYSFENLGHYGLASNFYCHFTSPIRRYPDTTNHRLVKQFHFSDDDKAKLSKKWSKQLEEIAKTSSICERKADEAERMVLLMKCAEYMEEHIGEEFTGTVVDIFSDGMQIELDNMVEGRVRLKDLKGKYVYYPLTQSYISLDNQEDYYLGDRLNLKVSYANKEKKEVDFKIVNKIYENERISKKNNERVRVMEKKKRADALYYNVNKGRKNNLSNMS